jgi:tetratricopeptide (TPR) repeat protein
MRKKTLFIATFVLFLLFLTTAASAAADASDQLKQAETLRKNKQYKQAEEICQAIIRDHPGTDYALKAQKKLVILYILMERQDDAEVALHTLIADFANHPDLPVDLYGIARHQRNTGHNDKAKSIQQLIAERWPDSVYAKTPLHIPKAEIFSHIRWKRYRKAQMAIEQLIADYSGHAYLPGTLYDIAGRYKQKRKYTAAKNVYSEIVRRYPDHWRARKARLRLAQMDILSLVDSGDAGAAQAAVDKLIADFPGQSELPSFLYQIAAKFKTRKEYHQARDVYQRIAREYPATPQGNQAQLDIPKMEILSFIHSGEDAAAQAAIEKLLTDFSEHKEIAKTVNGIGYNYRRLKKYEESKDVYQRVIATWPSSAEAIAAKKGVILCDVGLGDHAGAQAGIKELLSGDGAHEDVAQAINQVADRYRRSEKYENACQVYQYVVNNWPLSDEALSAQRNMVFCRIDLGDDAGAQAGIQRLFTDLTGHDEKWEALSRIAYRYRKLEKYEKALQIYQSFLGKWPNDDNAIHAQRGLVLCRIALGDDAGAQTAIEDLLTRFSWHRDIVKAVDVISKHYRRLEQYDKADHLYDYILDTWPDPAGGLWAQTQSAISQITAGSMEEAHKAVAKLLSDYCDSSEIGKCLNQIAKCYLAAGQHDRALELSDYVIANCPGWQRQVAMSARQNAAVSHIGLGNDEQAMAAVDRLAADFKDVWNVASAVFVIGEAYYNRAISPENEGLGSEAKPHFTKAVAVWQRIITELPADPTCAAHSHYFSAACYRRLGDHENAIEHFQKVVNDWPEYQYAWSAQCLIGECYEKLRDSGRLSEAEANPKIGLAYQAVIEKYGDCCLFGHACLKLARLYEKMANLDLSAEMYRIFAETAEPDDPRLKYVQARLEKLKGVKK